MSSGSKGTRAAAGGGANVNPAEKELTQEERMAQMQERQRLINRKRRELNDEFWDNFHTDPAYRRKRTWTKGSSKVQGYDVEYSLHQSWERPQLKISKGGETIYQGEGRGLWPAGEKMMEILKLEDKI